MLDEFLGSDVPELVDSIVLDEPKVMIWEANELLYYAVNLGLQRSLVDNDAWIATEQRGWLLHFFLG